LTVNASISYHIRAYVCHISAYVHNVI